MAVLAALISTTCAVSAVASTPPTTSTANFFFPNNGSIGIVAGQTWHFDPGPGTLIDVSNHGARSYLSLDLQDNLETVSIDATTVDGRPFTTGIYDSADPSTRQLKFIPATNHLSCGGFGREDITDIAYDASGNITRLAMTYAQTCDDALRYYYGNVVFNEPSTPIEAGPTGVDFGTGDPGQNSSAPVRLTNTTANPITITSVNAPAGFGVNPGACTGETLPPGAACQVTVSFTAPTAQTVTGALAVRYTGGQLRVPLRGTGRTSTTELIMYSTPGDPVGAGRTYDLTNAGGYRFAFGADRSIVNVQLNKPPPLNTNEDNFWAVVLQPMAGQTLIEGRTYTAQRWPFQAPGYSGLDVSGRGIGCNTLTGTAFLQQYALAGAVGLPRSLDLFFRQYCEGSTHPLVGELRFNVSTDGDAISAKYRSITGPHSALGLPIRDQTPIAAGSEQSFENGGVFASRSTGAHYLLNPLGAHYGGRGPLSVIGFPTTDELFLPDGIGRDAHFQHGLMYWSPTTGAHTVLGAILATWGTLGWERSRLGYPISDESRVSVGKRQSFQHGTITWNSTTRRTTVTYG